MKEYGEKEENHRLGCSQPRKSEKGWESNIKHDIPHENERRVES
jgi:hypothetical protein